MRTRLFAFTICCCLTAGCRSHDPLSAANVVARTVSQDLTVAEMSQLIGGATINMQVTQPNAAVMADMWSSFHRLGFAAAHNDTLQSRVNAAVTPTINSERVNLLLDQLRRQLPVDTATEATYTSAARDLYAVRHLSFAFPPRPTRLQAESVFKVARAIQPTITASNFVAMVKKYSSDTKTAANGGALAIFRKQAIVPAAAAALSKLLPDSVSKLVQTPTGFDVIQRMSWADARPAFTAAYSQVVKSVNDSVLSERAATAANIHISGNAADIVRAAVANPAAHSADTTVIATYDRGGKFTTADMLGWINTMQPLPRIQVLTGLPQTSDSAAQLFVRNVATRGVLLRSADSAKIDVPEARKAELREQFRKGVVDAWTEVGIAPAQLADSAATPADRERLAARRVDAFIERGMGGRASLTPIPVMVEAALDAAYPVQISADALGRAVEAAQTIRRAADSVRATAKPAPR